MKFIIINTIQELHEVEAENEEEAFKKFDSKETVCTKKSPYQTIVSKDVFNMTGEID